ncbi:MAG: ABC transporter permease [bacterium]
MRKILLVIRREYLSRVRQKSFWITTFLAPIGMALLVAVPVFLSTYSGGTAEKVAVVDLSGLFEGKLVSDETITFTFVDGDTDRWKADYKKEGYSGLLLIPKFSPESPSGITYYSDRQLGIIAQSLLAQQLNQELKNEQLRKAGINPDDLKKLSVEVSLDTVIIGSDGEKSGDTSVATGIGYGMGLLMYIVLIIYGVMVMRGVIEEKTTRIVEIIVSSVKPFQLMMGKILGIAAVGITQFILWVVLGFLATTGVGLLVSPILMQRAATLSPAAQLAPGQQAQVTNSLLASLSAINLPMMLGLFLFYFVFGYLLYASLFAAIGSAANDEGDVQSLSFPVTIPIIIAMFIMLSTIQNPNNPVTFWASFIPLFSPVVMLARIPFGVPPWEIGVSMALLVGGFIGATWMAAKIYRTGILMYGKKITLRELGKWLFYRG